MFKPILPGQTKNTTEPKRSAKTPVSGKKPWQSGDRSARMRPAGLALSGLIDPLLRKRGFLEASLINDWPSIIGAETAKWCQPEALKFRRGERVGGTLELRVAPGRGLEIQHMQDMLLERINVAFGYNAVTRLTIRQGALPPPPDSRIPASRDLTSGEAEAIDRSVAKVDNSNLREALANLGKSVAARDE